MEREYSEESSDSLICYFSNTQADISLLILLPHISCSMAVHPLHDFHILKQYYFRYDNFENYFLLR